MTDKDIKKAIKTCPWRFDGFKGNDKTDSYIICKGYCEPCMKIIDKGKCDTLIELFAKERKGENSQT